HPPLSCGSSAGNPTLLPQLEIFLCIPSPRSGAKKRLYVGLNSGATAVAAATAILAQDLIYLQNEDPVVPLKP
ncbi:MAG: hypothetical protein ACHQUC_06720, partial [Chlamydiales bacterium]